MDISKLTATDWAAIIGALAWLPPIISSISRWAKRPKIRVITQPTPEIGFTSYGPIFNLRIAFSVTNKDIVVTNLKTKVTHESGEKRTFEWRGVTQKIGQITYPEMGPVPFEKELNVLAVKLIERDIEERFVRFQELDFMKGKTEIEKRAAKKLAHLKQNDQMDMPSFLKSEEMSDLYSFIRQSFTWKAGNYTVQFLIDSPDKFTVLDDTYSFALTPLDIENLESNKSLIEKSFARDLLPADSQSRPQTLLWHWSYPNMQKRM